MKIYHWADDVGLHWEFCWCLDDVTRVAAWIYSAWPRYVRASA